jgi:hypothetical protein
MKYPNPRTLWFIIGVMAVIPIIFFLFHLSNPVFTENAMGNWFATMIGALIGILIALEINRVQQERQEKKESKDREKDEMEHKIKILGLVKSELVYNHSALLQRQPNNEKGIHRQVFVNRLKDELWNAFSDGGELQWLKDVQLLDILSTAYYYIRITVFLEDKYFDAIHFSGMMVQRDKYPKDYILDYLNGTDPDVLQNIEKALQEIDKSIALLEGIHIPPG